MNAKLEQKFEAIAQKAIEEAEEIKCSGREFVEGLRVMASQLKQRVECAADEFEKDDD